MYNINLIFLDIVESSTNISSFVSDLAKVIMTMMFKASGEHPVFEYLQTEVALN